jgi:hypothetical protein
MEAVRMRKANQIYTAEEKQAFAQFSKEEQQNCEKKILSLFKNIICTKQDQRESSYKH